MSSNDLKLKITEIFYSIQGESSLVGLPTVFIRLTGCPLRCHYCDTAYAFHGGETMTIRQIINQVRQYKTNYITVTGGEPLAQKNCLLLLRQLCDLDYTVSLETSGALDIGEVDSRVIKILDIKTPGSGEVDKNLYANLDKLSGHDQIKFVICDENDYRWTKTIIDKYDLSAKAHILLSPSHAQLSVQNLADWILRDNISARLQIQLHKYIWGDVAGK